MRYEKNQRPPWFLNGLLNGGYPLHYTFLLAYAALIGRLGPPDNKGPMSKEEVRAEFKGLWAAYEAHRRFRGRLFAISPNKHDSGATWTDLTRTVPVQKLKAGHRALSASIWAVLVSFDHLWSLLEGYGSTAAWDRRFQDQLWEVFPKPPANPSKLLCGSSPKPAAMRSSARKRRTPIGSSSQLHIKVTMLRRSRLA